MDTPSLRNFHNNYVRSIGPGELVVPEVHHLTNLTNEVLETLGIDALKVHIRSIALKHIYEKRNAYEYDILIDNLHEIVRFPDKVYKNNDIKRADFLFVKRIDEDLYACLIKKNAHPETGQDITIVVTAFKTTARYIKKFKLIRTWKGGTPSS